jgi:hypothetical protein
MHKWKIDPNFSRFGIRKQDKEKHLEMLKDSIDTEMKEGKLN